MQQTTISKSPRVEVVDALRGFAVLAILLVHNVEHFIYPVYGYTSTSCGGRKLVCPYDSGLFFCM